MSEKKEHHFEYIALTLFGREFSFFLLARNSRHSLLNPISLTTRLILRMFHAQSTVQLMYYLQTNSILPIFVQNISGKKTAALIETRRPQPNPTQPTREPIELNTILIVC